MTALWMWEENEQSKQVWVCPPVWRDWYTWAEDLDPIVKLGIFLNMPNLGEYLRAAKTKYPEAR